MRSDYSLPRKGILRMSFSRYFVALLHGTNRSLNVTLENPRWICNWHLWRRESAENKITVLINKLRHTSIILLIYSAKFSSFFFSFLYPLTFDNQGSYWCRRDTVRDIGNYVELLVIFCPLIVSWHAKCEHGRYTCTVSKVYARGRWKFYSEDRSRWTPLPTWTRSSLCRSRKQACRTTTKGAPWANSINYIPLRRNCTPYVFGFKGGSSHVHASHDPILSRRGEKEISWSSRPPRQRYKIRELHFRKEGRDPDEDLTWNHLWLEHI